MDEASGTAPPEGQATREADDHPPPDSEAARRAAQLEGIERDLDTVDSALSALDTDNLEAAEALAAELEESGADGHREGGGRPARGEPE